MIRLQFILMVIVLCIVNPIKSSKSIQELLPGYYDSDIVQRFKGEWEKYQHAFENAIEANLLEDFGVSSVNIYEENRHTSHNIAQGFTLTDGVINVCFLGMVLRELPSLVRPKLKMDLSNNHQNFKSRVGRMFIDSSYFVARNDSSEIYARPEDQKILSPFSLQQVDRFGRVTIIAEDCMLSGFSIITLNGDSVNLGHSPVRLSDCKFTVEISTPNSGAPPVIAPYFTSGPKDLLELVLSKPIREELQTKLQSAFYSYVNTSVLFGPHVGEFREDQQDLFKSYAEFIREYVSKVNQNTLKANKGVDKLPNYDVLIKSVTNRISSQCRIGVSDVTLYGLETAYVGRSGGPYKDDSPNNVADAIVFSSMQIRGKITHDDENQTSTYDFTAELTDIAVNVIIDIKNGRTNIVDMKMAGWRSLAFSIVPWETHYEGRVRYESLVYGYILNELPTRVLNHLKSILGGKTDSDGRNREYGQERDKDIPQSDGEPGSGIDDTEADDNKKKDDNIEKDFFTDDNIEKDFFTDDNIEKDFFTDDSIEKDFFTDDNIKKDFLSDDNLEKDFLSDDHSEKDFLSDDHLEKDFLSDDHLEKGSLPDDQLEKDFLSDDNLEKDFLSDDHLEKDFLSDDNLEKDFLSDDNLKKDFLSDDNLEKDFLSDDNLEKDFLSDDNLDKEFLSDDHLEKDFLSDDNVEKGFLSDENKKEHNTNKQNKNDNGENNTEDGNDFSKGDTGDIDEQLENNGNGGDENSEEQPNKTMNESEGDGGSMQTEAQYPNESSLGGEEDRKLDTDDVNVTDNDRKQPDNTDNKAKANEAFFSDDFLEKDFFSDSSKFRRFALNNNHTTNVRISGHRKDVDKDELSNGLNRDRTGNNNKKVVTVNNANNKETTTKTGKTKYKENIRETVKPGLKEAKKPVLPPNVHNRRRFNRHMSENEIR